MIRLPGDMAHRPAVPSPTAQVNKSRGYLYATAGSCLALCGPQSGALTSVSTQKQPPQIGRLAADKREQFRVGTMPVELCPP